MKTKHDKIEICSLDVLYGAVVLITLLSFLFFSRQQHIFHQVFTIFATFILYLLIRFSYKHYISNKQTLLVSFLVGIAGIEAARGLIQFLSNSEMKGLFYNVNHFGMYIALNIPLALVLIWRKEERRLTQILFLPILGLLSVCVILSKCRTVYVGLIMTLLLMLYIRFRHSFRTIYLRNLKSILFVWSAISMIAMGAVAVLIYYLKPLSAIGRILVWKVSLQMFSEFPVLGVGYNNFSGLYNLYQSRFFSQGLGSKMERLSASHITYAFNDYLESAVEFGIIGLVFFALFWYLIIRNVWHAFRRFYMTREHKDSLTVGMAGLVLLYIIMSFFYYPSRIIPIYIIFNICLACVASDNFRFRTRTSSLKVNKVFNSSGIHKLFQKFRALHNIRRQILIFFSLLTFLISAALLPSFYRQFDAEKKWHAARILSKGGHDSKALELYNRIYPNLKWDGNFLHQYGEILLKTGRTGEAIKYFEQGKEFWPNPYLLEDLALAHEKDGNLNEAINNASLADSILPWRLTSKSLLADFYYKRGDITNAAEYAHLVIETPMKLWTEEGEELKAKAWSFKKDLESAFNIRRTQQEETISLLPSEHQFDVWNALKAAGENAGQLTRAIRAIDLEKRRALAFLLANMPERDLKSLSADFLISNINYAFKARSALPHNKNIPEDIFLNYILPYSVLNEKRDNWRPLFYDMFNAIARMSPTNEETIMNLDREVFSTFQLCFLNVDIYSSMCSPFESIQRGSASCLELAIIFIDACRALGIPARLAIIPQWAHMKLGHSWPEVYVNGQWYSFDCFDPSRIGEAWERRRASETDTSKAKHRIYAVSFKKTGIQMTFWKNISFVDITESYVSDERKE